jgi:hypothetical protein
LARWWIWQRRDFWLEPRVTGTGRSQFKHQHKIYATAATLSGAYGGLSYFDTVDVSTRNSLRLKCSRATNLLRRAPGAGHSDALARRAGGFWLVIVGLLPQCGSGDIGVIADMSRL